MSDFVSSKMNEDELSASEDNIVWNKYGRNHETSENNESDVDDNPSGSDGAAFKSRLPANKMTSTEAQCFSDIANGPAQGILLFLYIRNRILELWLDDPKKELTLEAVLEGIPPPFNSDMKLSMLSARLVEYLTHITKYFSCKIACFSRPSWLDQFWSFSASSSHSIKQTWKSNHYWRRNSRPFGCASIKPIRNGRNYT